MINERWLLKQYPVGMPGPDNFEFAKTEVGTLADDDVLLAIQYISLDPGQRHFIDESTGLTPLGATVPAWAVGKVIDSRNADFPVGSYARDIMGQSGVQKYSIVPAQALMPISGRAPLSWYAGALGMSGLTAYFGLLDVGKPAPGETVLVSGATGSVGSVAAQIAKIKGCRVVGIARGAEKTKRLIETFGLDGAIDLRAEDLDAGLARTCPEGVDLFFDNVGGDILSTVFKHMKFAGRIVSAGMMTLYNREEPMPGIQNCELLFLKSLRWQGTFVGGHVAQYAQATRELEDWALEGKLLFDEHVEQGLERFPAMLDTLFNSRPVGKMVLQVVPSAA